MEKIKNFFNRVDAKLLIIEWLMPGTVLAGIFHAIIQSYQHLPVNYSALLWIMITLIPLWLMEFRKVHFTIEVDEDKTEE